ADRMESIVTTHWSAMAESDPTHKVKLIVDEWGAWHQGAADMPANYLWAYPGSLRDALVAALTTDNFNRHADKSVMANVAQLINTIHSLFIAATPIRRVPTALAPGLHARRQSKA